VEVDVLRSPDREEFTRFAFFRNRGYSYRTFRNQVAPAGRHSLITLDTSYSSILPDVLSRAPETAPLRFEAGELLNVRIFIDRSVVEVFVNGTQCVAARVYPGREDSLGVSLRAQGQDAVLIGLDAWQMKSVYESGG
jgi:beta-fructofuranosidase